MKNLVWLVLLFAITLLSNCGDDVPPLLAVTAQDLAKVNLSQTWEIGSNGSVTRDGQDVSDGFSNFTLTFSNTGTYSSSGGGDVWDTSGSWRFTSSDADDASSITIGEIVISVSVSVSHIQLQFSIPDGGTGIGARTGGIDGNWEISASQ